MNAPHDRINFNLRPNKRIERRMIADVLLRLARYDDPSRFAYIGMGSYYFADFVVMHKILGISTMISIESDPDNKDRFKFNIPFACISMEYGTTHDVLPTLAVFEERPVIVWLDYYGYLDDAKLGDIELITTKCKPGSAIIVTVNAATPAVKKESLRKFEQGLGEASRPPEYSVEAFKTSEAFSDLCRVAVQMRVQSALSARNGTEKRPLQARQIFNFRYKDGLRMATYGWLFLTKDQSDMIERVPKLLRSFPISIGKTAVDIEAPTLTFREIAHLRALLPEQGDADVYVDSAKPVAGPAAKKFALLYRYFPTFAHVEE